ncbi:uncharacterized protein N7482_001198 [Penicillium canariense]|uniref:Enoyl reductase (ER) domain-containing protein n=1 Tax=Penicillium canariense TaxID=189055 RepID=A0A9W9IGQ2_9EURO|nr:uncharacterized protein N7482_001198 [Penicillium canariense]KAJ5175321.1 hypothetical protein N7482_001198 [Penicillium canariense]
MKALVGARSIVTRLSNYSCGCSSADGVKIRTVPVPEISDNEILVRVRSVALNPTDFNYVDILSPRRAIIGCDYSGTVVRVGDKAPGYWQVGDRVAGFIHEGLYTDRGSFAEYLKIPGDLAWNIPPSVSDEEAATLGFSAFTAMLALNARLGVHWSDRGKSQGRAATPILIHSGSTFASLFAIQLAKLAGLKVVTTAPLQCHDLVKEYGADDVFDCRSPTAIEDIIQVYPNIERALDCLSEGVSTAFCADIVRKNRGWVVTTLDTGKRDLNGVRVDFVRASSVVNAEFQWPRPFGPKSRTVPSDNEALCRFYATLPELSQKLKPPPLKTVNVGLNSMRAALDMLRQGKFSGTKLVANLA